MWVFTCLRTCVHCLCTWHEGLHLVLLLRNKEMLFAEHMCYLDILIKSCLQVLLPIQWFVDLKGSALNLPSYSKPRFMTSSALLFILKVTREEIQLERKLFIKSGLVPPVDNFWGTMWHGIGNPTDLWPDDWMYRASFSSVWNIFPNVDIWAFLRKGFGRVPLTGNLKTFWGLYELQPAISLIF